MSVSGRLPSAAVAAQVRGTAFRQAGRLTEARDELRAALALAEQDRAHDSLQLVALLNEIGIVGKYRGDFADAAAAYDRALRILDDSGTEMTDMQASLLHNIAGLAHARGDAVGAISAAREGIAVRLASACTDPLDLAKDRAALAAILIDLHQTDEARDLLEEVLVVLEGAYGPESHEVAVALHNFGSLEYRCGDCEAAASMLDRSIRVKRTTLGTNHPDLAIGLHNLACAQAEVGLINQAIDSLEEAIALLAESVAANHPTLRSARQRLARLHQVAGSPTEMH